jgi:hypothetical protein
MEGLVHYCLINGVTKIPNLLIPQSYFRRYSSIDFPDDSHYTRLGFGGLNDLRIDNYTGLGFSGLNDYKD